jgi:hypothetical protein
MARNVMARTLALATHDGVTRAQRLRGAMLIDATQAQQLPPLFE